MVFETVSALAAFAAGTSCYRRAQQRAQQKVHEAEKRIEDDLLDGSARVGEHALEKLTLVAEARGSEICDKAMKGIDHVADALMPGTQPDNTSAEPDANGAVGSDLPSQTCACGNADAPEWPKLVDVPSGAATEPDDASGAEDLPMEEAVSDAETVAESPRESWGSPCSSASFFIEDAVLDQTKQYKAESLGEASTAFPADDEKHTSASESDSAFAETVNDIMEDAGGSDGPSLLSATIDKNAEFLENLPALNEARREQLKQCGLTEDELEVRRKAMSDIDDQVAAVAGAAVEVYKETLSVISARRKDWLTLKKFEKKALALQATTPPAGAMSGLARDAVTQLKESQVTQADKLIPALGQFRTAAETLKKMCEEESAAQEKLKQSKEQRALELQELIKQMEEEKATTDKLKDARGELSGLHEEVKRLGAKASSKKRLLAVGGVFLGCAIMAAGAIVIMNPAGIAATCAIVGMKVSATGCAVATAETVAAGFLTTAGLAAVGTVGVGCYKAVEIHGLTEQQQQAERKQAELQDAQSELALLSEKIQALTEQKKLLESHKNTLTKLKSAVDNIRNGVRQVLQQETGLVGILAFFGESTDEVLECAKDGDGDEEGITIWVENVLLQGDLLTRWKKHLDTLVEANDNLLIAVTNLNKASLTQSSS